MDIITTTQCMVMRPTLQWRACHVCGKLPVAVHYPPGVNGEARCCVAIPPRTPPPGRPFPLQVEITGTSRVLPVQYCRLRR